MTTYTTKDNDVMDDVCRAFYGREAGAKVTLPDLPRPLETIETVKLWD